MITNRSEKGDIRDLQKLLKELGFLVWREDSESGWWGKETQDAVVAAYRYIGWDHPAPDVCDGMWVSSAALAAIVSACHKHQLGDDRYSEVGVWDPDDEPEAKIGTGGSKTGTGGSKTGTGGSKTGTGGSKTGTGGSKTGTGGSKTGTGWRED